MAGTTLEHTSLSMDCLCQVGPSLQKFALTESFSSSISCMPSKMQTIIPLTISQERSKFSFNHYNTNYNILEMGLNLLIIACLLVLASSKLVYLAELFRHGARYSTSDFYDANETKQFAGNLTAVGMRQQHLLGSYLRKDYQQALGLHSSFDPSQVEVFAEDGSPRCIESAYAHMSGWFPLGEGEELPQVDQQFLRPPFQTLSLLNEQQPALDAAYQPIPVKSGKTYFVSCPMQVELIAQRAKVVADKIALLEAEHQLFANRMRNIFKIPLPYDNLYGLVELYDVVVADMNLGRKLPSDFTQLDFQELKFVQNYFLILIYAGDLANVASTPIIKGVVENMRQVVNANFTKKLTVLSAHDTNVAPMLSFLNLTDAECVQRKYRNQSVAGNCAEPVPFASSIQFELVLRSQVEVPKASDYVVKVKYNGEYYKLCNSGSIECEFPSFEARVRAQLVDYDKVCGRK